MMGSVGSGQFRATRKKWTGVDASVGSAWRCCIECCMPRDVMLGDRVPLVPQAGGTPYEALRGHAFRVHDKDELQSRPPLVFAIRLTLRPWEPSRGTHIIGTTCVYLFDPSRPLHPRLTSTSFILQPLPRTLSSSSTVFW